MSVTSSQLLIVAAFASCAGHGHDTTKPMGRADCREAIEGLVSGDPSKLRPLPAGCTLDDVTGVVRVEDGWTRGELGEPGMSATIRWLAGGKLAARAWLIADKLVLVDSEKATATAADYTRVLGEPEAKLDYAWLGATLAGSELVWPQRGAMVVANGDKAVIRVAVFAPTTLADYRAQLRVVEENREEP
jgi:hypothetical protein